ncbi:hypothetical protein [Actinokineospora sp. HUAS TT18]|uniref:hypothetical protein n=1 Tax=Actinokineospora sp. HUAS TT18 TaxID=3447451 RepID=UPI003F525AF6
MPISYRIRWAAALPRLLPTALAALVGVVAVSYLIDFLFNRGISHEGPLTRGLIFGPALAILLILQVRRNVLSLVPDAIEVARDAVVIGFRWVDFAGVTVENGKECLTFRQSFIRPGSTRKIPPMVERRLRKEGADRKIVIGNYLVDWQNSPVGDMVRQYSS